MMVIPVTFIGAEGEIPPMSFNMEHDAVNLVMSCLGHGIVELEDKSIELTTLLEDIRLYQTSELNTIVDKGRTALVQVGGQVEGVTLPPGINFKFPEVEKGFISDYVETLRVFAHEAIDKWQGTHICFNAE